MASDLQKWGIGLLVGVVALQGWIFSRQNQLKSKIDQTYSQVNDLNRSIPRQLDNLQAQLQTRDDIPAWMSTPQVAVMPQPECRDSSVKTTWSLTEWTAGTKAHLQYRRGTAEDWHEVQVQDLGQQSYEAMFPIAGGPGLLWKVSVGRNQPATVGASPRIVYYPPESAQYYSGFPAMPAYQYRIVVDVPGGSRATSPQALVLGPDHTVFAGFNVTVGQDGNYLVTAAVDPSPRNPCVQVHSVIALPFTGDNPSGEYPLAASGQNGAFQATWKSDTNLTRIDLVVRYGIHESVIPVNLTGAQ